MVFERGFRGRPKQVTEEKPVPQTPTTPTVSKEVPFKVKKQIEGERIQEQGQIPATPEQLKPVKPVFISSNRDKPGDTVYTREQLQGQAAKQWAMGLHSYIEQRAITQGERGRIKPSEQYIMQNEGPSWSKGQILTGEQILTQYDIISQQNRQSSLGNLKGNQQFSVAIKESPRGTIFYKDKTTGEYIPYETVLAQRKYNQVLQEYKQAGPFIGAIRYGTASFLNVANPDVIVKSFSRGGQIKAVFEWESNLPKDNLRKFLVVQKPWYENVIIPMAFGVGFGAVGNLASKASKVVSIGKKSFDIYKGTVTGAKIIGAGAVSVGVGVDIGASLAYREKGLMSNEQFEAKILGYGLQFSSMAVGAGGLTNIRNKMLNNAAIKQASRLNIQGGQAPEYGIFRAGTPQERILTQTKISTTDILNRIGTKSGKEFKYQQLSNWKPGKAEPVVFLDVAGKGNKIVSIGSGEFKGFKPGDTGKIEPMVRTDVITKTSLTSKPKGGITTTYRELKYEVKQPDLYKESPMPNVRDEPLRFSEVKRFNPETKKYETVDWFAESSGKAKAIKAPKIKHQITEKIGDIDHLKTNKSFTKEEMVSLELKNKPGEFLKTEGTTKIKANLFDTAKARIKNYINPRYWVPLKEKLSFGQRDFTNIKLNEKTGMYEPTKEFQDWLGKSKGGAIKDYSKQTFHHDLKQGAMEYIKGLEKYKLKQNKPKITLKSNTYSGGEKAIGSQGTAFLESVVQTKPKELQYLEFLEQDYAPPSKLMPERIGSRFKTPPMTASWLGKDSSMQMRGINTERDVHKLLGGFSIPSYRTETKNDIMSNQLLSELTTPKSIRDFVSIPSVKSALISKQSQIIRQEQQQIQQNILTSEYKNRYKYSSYKTPIGPWFPMGFGGGSEGSGGYSPQRWYARKFSLIELNIPTMKDIFGG